MDGVFWFGCKLQHDQGLKLTLTKCQMQVTIGVGEYLKQCQSPVGKNVMNSNQAMLREHKREQA